jgi:hypothetical protein
MVVEAWEHYSLLSERRDVSRNYGCMSHKRIFPKIISFASTTAIGSGANDELPIEKRNPIFIL